MRRSSPPIRSVPLLLRAPPEWPVWIEQAAYANRWRDVTPGAKALFAGCGLAAAFVAPDWKAELLLAALLAAVTLGGARVPARLYARVVAPAGSFVVLSCATLLVAVAPSAGGWPEVHWHAAGWPEAALTGTRAMAALAAMVGLVLTTPLSDLIGLARRLRVPEVLVDVMVLCYRMVFVFMEAWDDGVTAQAARLGYGPFRRSVRSLALLAANLAAQIWSRALALQAAASARNGDGPLNFLAPDYAHARRDLRVAGCAGAVLLAGMVALRGGLA